MAAQVRVVAPLHPGLADLVAGGVALPLQQLELRGRDLVHVAEHLGREVAVRVVAQVRVGDADARELLGVLVEVVDRRRPLDVLAHDHRRDRVAAARLDPAQHLVDRDVHDPREPPQLVQARGPGHRQVGRVQLDRRAGDVDHERPAVHVEDLAARRLDADRANLVVERRLQVLRPGKHLQRPEPEEEDAEGEQRDRAEDPDPQRELRREAVRALDARVGRQEAVGARAMAARAGASQGAAPPSRPRPAGPVRGTTA